MGRALLIVAAALGLCFAGLGLVVYLTRDEDGIGVDAILSESITRAVEESQRTDEPVVLSDITPFRWDRVLVFRTGTPRRQVSKALGYRFDGELPYTAQSEEVFVFTLGGRFVRFADYRGLGRFSGMRRPFERLTPDQAIWTVRDLDARLTPGPER